MRITRLSFSFTIGLLTACAPAQVVTTPVPTPVAGNRIRYAVQPDSTKFVTARLISLNANRLVFQRVNPDDPDGRWVTASVATDSIARLQVHVGRRGNAVLGAGLGALVGGALGVVCATEEGFVTPEECIVGYAGLGTGIGLLIGAFAARSDVWAPTALPERPPELPPAPPITAASVGVEVLPIPLLKP